MSWCPFSSGSRLHWGRFKHHFMFDILPLFLTNLHDSYFWETRMAAVKVHPDKDFIIFNKRHKKTKKHKHHSDKDFIIFNNRHNKNKNISITTTKSKAKSTINNFEREIRPARYSYKVLLLYLRHKLIHCSFWVQVLGVYQYKTCFSIKSCVCFFLNDILYLMGFLLHEKLLGGSQSICGGEHF